MKPTNPSVYRSRVLRIAALIPITYCLLWALTAVMGTRDARSEVIAGLHIDQSFRELATTDKVYNASGHVYAVRSSSYGPGLVTVTWARSDENYGTSETELYLWLGRAVHVRSFTNNGWRREYPR
jgi:hypothetical protein